MVKKTVFITLLLAAFLSVNAQNYVNELYFDARVSMYNTFDNSNDDAHYYKGINGDFFNFNMKGNITDNISYRIRQRLNKKIDSKNPFNATDFLYIDWHIDKHWTLNFGKQEIYIGGFEYDYSPIDVYYWGYFCDTIAQSYSFGASMGYIFNDKNNLIFQITQSPWGINSQKNGFNNNLLAYNLIWFGQFAPWFKTIWSVNAIEYSDGKFMNIIALGNRFEFGNAYLEADINNRYYDYVDDFLFDSWSFTGKFNYKYKDFNFFAKGGYDKQTDAYNIHTDNSFYGAGAEYFPLHNEDLRLHAALYHYETEKDVTHFDIGITWKLNIINKKK